MWRIPVQRIRKAEFFFLKGGVLFDFNGALDDKYFEFFYRFAGGGDVGDPSLIVRGSRSPPRSNIQRAGVSIAQTGKFLVPSRMIFTLQLANLFIPFPLVCPFQPPLTDLAVVLILTSNIGALKFRARALFDLWLKQGTFPFAQLELVLSLRRSNEVN